MNSSKILSSIPMSQKSQSKYDPNEYEKSQQKLKLINPQNKASEKLNKDSDQTTEKLAKVSTKQGQQFSQRSFDMSSGVLSNLQSAINYSKTNNPRNAFQSHNKNNSIQALTQQASKIKLLSPMHPKDIILGRPEAAVSIGSETLDSIDPTKVACENLPPIQFSKSLNKDPNLATLSKLT